MMWLRHVLPLLLIPLIVPPAVAQVPAVRSLSLAEARGSATSERTGIARAGVLRAQGQLRQARSEFFPQLTGSASYTRTLALPPSSRPAVEPSIMSP